MTYTLTASEEGKKVLVEVRFTDNGGSSEGPLVSALYPSTQSQTVDPNTPPTASDGTVTATRTPPTRSRPPASATPIPITTRW